MRTHKSIGRDLLCSSCIERGYTVGKYEKYQCAECLEHFGHRKFHPIQSRKLKEGADFICNTCKTKARCSKCLKLFGRECWATRELREHLYRGRKLVCGECRAQGFRPGNLIAYTCRTCEGTFGWRKFSENARRRSHLWKIDPERLERLPCQKKKRHQIR